MTDAHEELLALFRSELQERLGSLDSHLAALVDSRPGPERAAAETAVFSDAHRLKGAAGTLQLRELEAVAGDLSTTYAGVRSGEESVDPEALAAARSRLAAAGSHIGEARLDLGVESKPAEAQTSFTVLHVEDDPATLSLVERTLGARPGATVIAAQDGTTALELAREHRPAVVLLDLQLPGASGAEVLRQLRADPATATIPVVITSGGGAPGEVEELLAAGARDYLEKPLALRRVRELVDAILAESS